MRKVCLILRCHTRVRRWHLETLLILYLYWDERRDIHSGKKLFQAELKNFFLLKIFMRVTCWTCCVKEQWLHTLFFFFTYCHVLGLKAKKRVEYIKVPIIMINDRVNKGHTLNMFSFFVEQIRCLSSKQLTLNQLNQKKFLTQKPPDN